MAERILQEEFERRGAELPGYGKERGGVEFGGVEFPEFLITQPTYKAKLAKARELDIEVESGLRSGAVTGDAGDVHGQYHNEVEWYRIQDLERKTTQADGLKNGLDRAIVVPDYNVVRQAIVSLGLNLGSKVTLGSVVFVQYGDDSEDTEEIMLVSRLDGAAQESWVSVETPLAQAIEGKEKDATVFFNVKNGERTIQVKIREIK